MLIWGVGVVESIVREFALLSQAGCGENADFVDKHVGLELFCLLLSFFAVS